MALGHKLTFDPLTVKRAKNGKGWELLPPQQEAAQAVIQDAVTSPGRLREIIDNDWAMVIFAQAMAHESWPKLHAQLLKRGHTQADIERVYVACRTFAVDCARMQEQVLRSKEK
jgi:hypothetical protein